MIFPIIEQPYFKVENCVVWPQLKQLQRNRQSMKKRRQVKRLYIAFMVREPFTKNKSY